MGYTTVKKLGASKTLKQFSIYQISWIIKYLFHIYSEIILIRWFGAQKHVLLLMLKTVVQLNILVETVI